MISVTPQFKAAIDAPSRFIKVRGNIYYDGEGGTPVAIDREDIIDFTILEELYAESSNPLGAISSNVLDISLRNYDYQYSHTNIVSPYYGKLVAGVKMVLELGLETSTDIYEWIPLGTYYTAQWNPSDDNMECAVLAYDRLQKILNTDLPSVFIGKNLTLKDLFEKVFNLLGVPSTDLIIDANLTEVVPYSWLPNKLAKEFLSSLTTLGLCYIMVNRDNKIVIKKYSSYGTSVGTYDDVKQIETSKALQSYRQVYSKIDMQYALLGIDAETEVAKIENLYVPTGDLQLPQLAFTGGPIAALNYIRVTGSSTVKVKEAKIGCWSADITLNNTGTSSLCQLEIQAKAIRINTATYSATNTVTQALIGDKKLTINEPLIQTQAMAKSIGDKLLAMTSKQDSYISGVVRGNPAFELGDNITWTDGEAAINAEPVLIVRQQLRYDGALDMEITSMKVSAVA